MKRMLGPILLFAVLIAVTPAVALLPGGGATVTLPETSSGSTDAYTGGEITVFDESAGQTLELTMREYVTGALICEMPASYEPAALQAQAIAIHTYALTVQAMREAAPDPALEGGVIAVDTANHIGYTTRELAIRLYGDNFNEYYRKMQDAVDATLKYILTYDGQPISACYHAVSPGRTEASENIFVSALPYLVSVDSSWDEQAPDFETEKRFSATEFSDLLYSYDAGFTTSGSPSGWLGSTDRSEAGTVLSQTICARQYVGTTLRTVFGLRSAAFDLTYEDDTFVFTVRGYGHGVGMSQYGANYLALQGKTSSEILAYYYPGAVLTEYTV